MYVVFTDIETGNENIFGPFEGNIESAIVEIQLTWYGDYRITTRETLEE